MPYILCPLRPIVFTAFLIFMSCSSSGDDDPSYETIKPTNLSITANVVGKDNEHPNGDGSGQVNFTISATNATSYKVLINNETLTLSQSVFSYKFITPGTKDHAVIVSAYNGLNFISKIISVTVYVKTVDNNENMQLVWSDEFNNGSLDLSKWSYEIGTGVNGDFGTGQLDRATERPENVSFQSGISGADGGCLVITTRAESYIDRNYTSGRINTADKASWGPGHRIVARVYAKDVRYKGQGFAFWMMPQEIPSGYNYIMWPQGGEIDIMEYVGSIPYHNLGTVHYAWEWQNNEYHDWTHGHLGGYYDYQTQQTPDPAEPGYGSYPPPANNLYAGSAAFHEYGIDWYHDRIEFFIDNKVYHIHYLNDGGAYAADGQDQISVTTIDNRRVNVSEYSNHFNEWHPFEHKMYAILSAGVGGQQYTYGGPIVPEAQFPCSVYIDWVRVYSFE